MDSFPPLLNHASNYHFAVITLVDSGHQAVRKRKEFWDSTNSGRKYQMELKGIFILHAVGKATGLSCSLESIYFCLLLWPFLGQELGRGVEVCPANHLNEVIVSSPGLLFKRGR